MAGGETILIVEDEAALAQLLEYNLQKHGYRTLVAPDGLSACRLAAAHAPDLILLDILLPDLDGMQLCRMLKLQPEPRLAQIPVVMVSALGDTDHIRQGLELGAAAYFTKPYALRDVLAVVAQLLAQRRGESREAASF